MSWTGERPLRSLGLTACHGLRRFDQFGLEALSVYDCPRLEFETIANLHGLKRLSLQGKDAERTLKLVPSIETLEMLQLRVRMLPRSLPDLERFPSLKLVSINTALDWMMDQYQAQWPSITFRNDLPSIFESLDGTS
jgi:hypothetical protein